MALAQYLHLPEYEKFFQERVKAGDTVILDNGAYEGQQMQPAMLNKWVRRLKPSVVVLPDKPHDLLRTVQYSMQYLEEFGLPYGTEAMMVLHAEDGRLAHFETAYNLCPTKWIGFSRLTRCYSTELKWPWHRAQFAKWLQDHSIWRSSLFHHALGMLNGNVEELKLLSSTGFDSCDSSAPVWRGLLGYSMQDNWPNYEFQPFISDEVNNWTQADINLNEVLQACGQD
jgi:hypothetical protein